MIAIEAVGNDKKIETELTDFFFEQGAVIIKDDIILQSGTKYLISFASKLKLKTKAKTSLLLYYSNQTPPKSILKDTNYIGICESGNTHALSFFMQNRIQALTYGLATSDTITFSSITDEHSQISLQREVKNINNNIIGPFEFILNCKNLSQTTQLIIGTLKILCEE